MQGSMMLGTAVPESVCVAAYRMAAELAAESGCVQPAPPVAAQTKARKRLPTSAQPPFSPAGAEQKRTHPDRS